MKRDTDREKERMNEWISWDSKLFVFHYYLSLFNNCLTLTIWMKWKRKRKMLVIVFTCCVHVRISLRFLWPCKFPFIWRMKFFDWIQLNFFFSDVMKTHLTQIGVESHWARTISIDLLNIQMFKLIFEDLIRKSSVLFYLAFDGQVNRVWNVIQHNDTLKEIRVDCLLEFNCHSWFINCTFLSHLQFMKPRKLFFITTKSVFNMIQIFPLLHSNLWTCDECKVFVNICRA